MTELDDGTYKITWENTVNVSCGIRLDINAPKRRAAAETLDRLIFRLSKTFDGKYEDEVLAKYLKISMARLTYHKQRVNTNIRKYKAR